MTEWQPAATAPKDGTPILALPWTKNPADVTSTWWLKEDGRWANWPWTEHPTHWMPLPAPPAD